jgi:hypothetical protein
MFFYKKVNREKAMISINSKKEIGLAILGLLVGFVLLSPMLFLYDRDDNQDHTCQFSWCNKQGSAVRLEMWKRPTIKYFCKDHEDIGYLVDFPVVILAILGGLGVIGSANQLYVVFKREFLYRSDKLPRFCSLKVSKWLPAQSKYGVSQSWRLAVALRL